MTTFPSAAQEENPFLNNFVGFNIFTMYKSRNTQSGWMHLNLLEECFPDTYHTCKFQKDNERMQVKVFACKTGLMRKNCSSDSSQSRL